MAPALVREGRDAELGSTAEHFAEFDDEPMAPASIGQVRE
jgi:predicted unusual protein kinase regulating ubiquinone biosynthesis (AarF/ABC1/UbiB family)